MERASRICMPFAILICSTQRVPMNRQTIKLICSCLVIGVLSFSVSPAVGQYYENPGQQIGNKRPLNQLPPIVSSDQVNSSSELKPAKSLFIPTETTDLPPIVTPDSKNKAPFVYQKSTQTSNRVQTPGPLVPQSLPPITQAPKSNPLPPITQPKSSSGVPIYSTGTPKSIIRQPSIPTPTRSFPTPARSFPTPARSFPMPGIQDGSGTRSVPPGAPQDLTGSLEPGNIPQLPDVEIDAPTVVEPNVTVPPTTQSRIPSESQIPTTPGTNDYFDQTAPSNGIDSGCSSCGPGGCYDPAVVQQQNGCCGSVSNAGHYLFADALFWTRADGEIQLSSSFGLNDFNFVGGGRITLGRRDNSVSGRELTYFGTGDLDEIDSRTSATGGLQPLFTAGGGLNFTQITGFQNGTLHRQEKESQLHSLEYNRIKWGWDVLKALIGVRYIYFDDSYEFFSMSSSGTNGLFVQDSVNNLFGVHGGWELFYDVGYRTSASFQSKFGAYVNAANVDTNLFNGGVNHLSQEQDDSSIASTIELNFMSHFQISPRSRFRFGYDIFLGWGFYTVENNVPRNTFANGFQIGTPVITSATGTNLNTNNDTLFLHGPSIGFEIFR